MAQRDYDLAVFIGRFQIFHNGHLAVINEAFKRADHVLVIVGSAHEPRSYRNPFTSEERENVIMEACSGNLERISVEHILDTIYNDGKWVSGIQDIVNDHAYWLASYMPAEYAEKDIKIALIGHEKDNSSFYLKLFPQWDNISVPNVENLSSTELRKVYFSDDHVPDLLFGEGRLLPESTIKFLSEFKMSDDYVYIRDEYEFIKKYKDSWASAPYEPTFVTTDACVVQSGHVLLIERKARPGKGLWALPGGFLEASERIEDGMIRELREETRIKVPAPVLRGNIKARHVFDDPHRSARGRTITHGFLINLPPDVNLPQVKGGDDAAVAKWWPIGEITRDMMFEDHFDIVTYFVSLL
jgi:bifunctional NMN adenylyltransferase/nudix hydrolase